MTEEVMTQEQFREAKQSGVDLTAEPEVKEDAAPVEEEQQEEIVVDEQQEEQSEEEPKIPEEHQTAWAKRAERERKKGAEEAEAKLKTEFDAELAKYKRFFDESGVDPESALKVLEQNRLRQESRKEVQSEAQSLAYQYGWDEKQTEDYINQQSDLRMKQLQQENEMRELRVQVAINELADNADYPGIKQMKSQITNFVSNNPKVSVEQAYWAVGGSSLAQQLKREAEQREIAKRSQTGRKVVTDSGASSDNKGSLPPEAVAFMKREGMTEAQVKMLMGEGPKNLTEYRKMMNGRK